MDLRASLDECAEAYERFCVQYRPKPKTERKSTWDSQLLKELIPKKGKRKPSPGQKELWENVRIEDRDDVKRVAEKFIKANKRPET